MLDYTVYLSIPNMTCHSLMHVLVAHVPKFLRDIGSLTEFSQQGLEKLITKDYYKSTNRNEDVLRQMMLKYNCMEELMNEQYCSTKLLHVCSTCRTRSQQQNIPHK